MGATAFDVLLQLGLADKLLTAAGAADADLTLSTGDTDTLLAVGAAEIAVLAVLQPCPKAQPPLVFRLPADNVSGKHTVEHKGHHSSVQDTQESVEQITSQENIQNIIQQA